MCAWSQYTADTWMAFVWHFLQHIPCRFRQVFGWQVCIIKLIPIYCGHVPGIYVNFIFGQSPFLFKGWSGSTLSRPFCLLKGCLVYAFVFYFFLFCFVLFSQYEVCVLRCLSRLYTVYLSLFFIFITPTNHSHAKPLSIPILVNYFLWNIFM